MTDAPKAVATLLTGRCACVHLGCEHRQGKCQEVPVVIEMMLGLPSKLCEKCAERWSDG